MENIIADSAVVNDGNNTAIPGGVKMYKDPNDSNKKGAVVALIKLDGSLFDGNVAIPAGLPSTAKLVQTTINRPANQTAYGAGAVIGGVITLTNVVNAAGVFYFTDVKLMLNIAAIPSGMGAFRLHLYSSSPPSNYTNTNTWDLPAGDRASYIGYVDIPTVVDLGSTLYVKATQLNEMMQSAGTTLYGYLITPTGFTPGANSEVYVLTTGTTMAP